LGPFEAGLVLPVANGDSVLQSAFIKSIAWKDGELGVHSVLNLESYWPDAHGHESFEERFIEASFDGFPGQDNWS